MQMQPTPDQHRFYTALLFELGTPRSAATLPVLERLADLQVWKALGLAELQNAYTSTVSDTPYQRALARYAALRNSPNFAMLVLSIAAKRGAHR